LQETEISERKITMDEYINRESVYEDFEKCNSENPKWTPSRVKTLISRQKAADVAPVRHGRWECGKPCPVCGENRFKGLDADIWADWEPPYCPNCGAKMDRDAD
jgi:hypothetical protein